MGDEIENNCIFPDIYIPKLSSIIFFAGNWLAVFIELLEYILALKTFHNPYLNYFISKASQFVSFRPLASAKKILFFFCTKNEDTLWIS